MSLCQGIRDEISRFEAMALVLVEPKGDQADSIFQRFPSHDSPMHHANSFISTLRAALRVWRAAPGGTRHYHPL